jgi:prophage regulatory protein
MGNQNKQPAAAGDLQAVVNKPAICLQRQASKAEADFSELPKKERLIKLPEVMSRTACGKSLIYSMQAMGKFPASVRIGGRSVAWTENSVDSWIQDRIEQATAQKVAA